MNLPRINRPGISLLVSFALAVVFSFLNLMSPDSARGQLKSYQKVVESVQSKMVKIYGAGGLKGLEAYQSGFLISDDGYILTVWSYVLDDDDVICMLNDGQKLTAKLKGYDPQTEIALLKVEALNLDYFNLDEAVKLNPGAKVLALSNLYGVATGNEPTSVQFGVVSAKTKLSARRGGNETNYQGQVYLVDAMTNNPGAAGGAITDRNGNIAAIIGKELRSNSNNIWINFGIPISEIADSVDKIRSGKIIAALDPKAKLADEPMTPALLGLVLLPNVVSNTPPFVDRVIRGSTADKAGIRPDDLVIEIDSQLTVSRDAVIQKLGTIERDQPVKVTIQRGRKFLNLELEIK